MEFICGDTHNRGTDAASGPGDRLRLSKFVLAHKTMMGKKTKITSAQIRAARGLLNWSARELSERSGVSQSTIHRAERAEGRPTMHEHGLAAIKAAMERYGVEFLDESGVRLGLEQGAGSRTVDPATTNFSMETRARWVPSSHS